MIDPAEIIRTHTGAWWETHGRIWAKDRTKGLVCPKANHLQAKIQKVVDKCEDLEIPVRILGLKPRARGSTTYFTALGYSTMRRRSTSAVFIGGQSDQTVGLWNMMKTYHQNDGFNWGNTGEVNEKGAHFSNGSRAKKETAKDVQAGIGDTYQLLHATEVARWAQFGVANAGEVMANILKAVPLLAWTYVFLESTAERVGADFHSRWLKATDADAFLSGEADVQFGSYIRIFAPWFEFQESVIKLTPEQKLVIQRTLDSEDEFAGEKMLIDNYATTDADGTVRLGTSVTDADVWEQLAWRRYAIREECGRDVKIFDRDYPHSWESAFQQSGDLRFNATGISVMRKRAEKVKGQYGLIQETKTKRLSFVETEKNEAQYVIFEKPTAGRRVLLSVDNMTGASQAAGLDPDYHGVFALRDGFHDAKGQWVRPATAARIIPCRWETDMLADAVWDLARYYGGPSGCLIVVEVNMDRGLIEILKSFGANLYIRQHFNQRDQKLTNAYGYQTNDKTRERLITRLATAIREWDTPGDGIDIWCPHALQQLANFVTKDGRSEAAQGFHDDDVLSIAMGLTLIEHATVCPGERASPWLMPPDLRETTQGGGLGAYS